MQTLPKQNDIQIWLCYPSFYDSSSFLYGLQIFVPSVLS